MRIAKQKFISALAELHYLTVSQLLTVGEYKESSRRYIYRQVNELVAADLIMALPRQVVTQPRLYTLTAKGRRFAAFLGKTPYKRYRVGEEKERGANAFFVAHTIAVTDVLIAARLLAKTEPAIRLNRMLTERELQRTIYVAVPQQTGAGITMRKICIEPDAAVDFIIQGKWQHFFHIEVYRSNLREDRFKHKIAGYAAYATSTIHQELFQTPSLSIAIFCTTKQLAETLKRWTEEVLQEGAQADLGEQFFFTSSDPATTNPEELFLSPVWETAFSTTKTPLLVLAGE